MRPYQPSIQWVSRGGFLSHGNRAAEREADHLLPPSAKVKNQWSYNSSPPIRPHSTDRDIPFTFALKIRILG